MGIRFIFSFMPTELSFLIPKNSFLACIKERFDLGCFEWQPATNRGHVAIFHTVVLQDCENHSPEGI